MIVSVINDDQMVVIDNQIETFDLELPSNIWAIQWDGTKGEIEYRDTTPNKEIDDFSAYKYLVDKHKEVQTKREEEVKTIEANLSYKEKRINGYGSISEQLDMQYWDAINGTTLWQDHIAKVKSDIPKI